jgi:ubiquinone/menaquinone biosynthesis C-methylase UbiE
MKPEDAAARDTERVRRFYDRFAGSYDRWLRLYDALLLDDRRGSTCRRARGRTLELAIGTGLNLSLYPRDVKLVGIDVSTNMLVSAARRARHLGLEVELKVGDAQGLDLADGSFDTVVATLVLSTLPDPQRACAEALRVLKTGGRFLVLDHVRSPIAAVRWMQRLLDPPASRFLHVHVLRDPLGALGFRIEHCGRSKGGLVEQAVATKEA